MRVEPNRGLLEVFPNPDAEPRLGAQQQRHQGIDRVSRRRRDQDVKYERHRDSLAVPGHRHPQFQPGVFQSSAHGVAAGRVALQYRDETRQVTVYGTATFGAPAPLIQGLDDLGIRMDWLVFDRVGSGYVEREFRVDPSFRTTTNRGPLMLYLLEDGERRYPTPGWQAVAARRDK